MANRLYIYKVLFILSFCLYFNNAESQNTLKETYNISGIVLDSSTMKPLKGVYVTDGRHGNQTNAEGKFVIKDLPAGPIKIFTMYYSNYSIKYKTFVLQADTSITFYLKEESLKLDGFVVTGTRTSKRLSEAPILTTVIQDREIRQSASISTMETLEDNIPGIISSPNPMGNNLRIKGLNSRYILFLVDGERMVSESAGGNITLEQVDVDNIKKIEIVNGASSALYGSNAVGAVINIITKEPIHKFEAGAHVTYGSFNTLTTNVYAGTKLKKISSRLSLYRNSSNGFDLPNIPYAAKYEDWGSNLNFSYRPIDRADVNLTVRLFQHELLNPENSMNTSHILRNNINVGTNAGYISKSKKNNIRLSVNYSYYLDFMVLENLDNKRRKNNTAGYLSSRLVNTYTPNDKWEIVGGLEQNNEHNYATTTLGPEPTRKEIHDYNAFAQVQYEPFKNFDIVAGARHTYSAQFKSALTPKLSLMYSIAGFKFRGGIGTAFRAPSIKELYYDFDHLGMFWIYGNPDLTAEKGLYSSLSAEYSKSGVINISLSGYYNNINNKISQYEVVNDDGSFEYHYKNVSSATIKGIDLTVIYLLLKQVELKANYSFCDARNNVTGLQLSSNVKHSTTLGATWNGKVYNSPFSLQFSGRITSPRLYQYFYIDDNGEDVLELRESKPYYIWKAVLVKPFRINKHNIELTLKCDNIFAFKDKAFVNPGRQYMVGLRYSFK